MFEAMGAGWNFRLWNEEVLEREFGGEWPQLSSQCCHLSQQSNVARYLILREHGGLYLDTDVELFCLPGQGGFDDPEQRGSWIAGTSAAPDPLQVNPAVLASEPGGAYVTRMVEAIEHGEVDLSRHMAAGPCLAIDKIGPEVHIWPGHVWHGRRGQAGALGHHYGWGPKLKSFLRRHKLPPTNDIADATSKT